MLLEFFATEKFKYLEFVLFLFCKKFSSKKDLEQYQLFSLNFVFFNSLKSKIIKQH